MDRSGSGSYPNVGFGISGGESSRSATKELLYLLLIRIILCVPLFVWHVLVFTPCND